MTWTAQPERGSKAIVRLGVFLVRHGGWTLGRLIALLCTVWFLATSARARAASRDYLRRALDRPVGFADVARHFSNFSAAVLDRVFLLTGQMDGYDVQTEGLDLVQSTLAHGQGCILLGAHLGSFEVLRSLARQSPVPVWALMYQRSGGTLMPLLDRMAPSLRERVLEIGDTASMIRARECVERGEIVGILADRSPPGHRMVAAPFLGENAQFPSGPFILAATLGAPVLLFQGIRTGPRQYRIRFAPFADRVVLRREQRAADLRQYVCRYAAALEQACRAHPFNWFNFFPFWEQHHARPHPAQPAAVARSVLSPAPPGLMTPWPH